MQRLGLIDHRLQCNGICDELVVNNGFFLICGVVGPKMTATAEGQMFGESE